MAPFLKARGLVYLEDVKTEHLSAFQETWVGRLRKDRTAGEFIRQPKSQLGKQKNQEFVKMPFRCARELRSILDNPAELLLSVKTPKIEVKKKRLRRSRNCWRRSSACFPTSRKP